MRLQKLPNELKILQFFSLPNICAIIHYLISLIYFKINLKNNLKSQIAINSNEVFALTQSNIQILLCKEGIKENKHIFLLYIWLLYFWLFVSWAPCRQSCLFLDMLIKKDIHLSVWRWFLDCWTPPQDTVVPVCESVDDLVKMSYFTCHVWHLFSAPTAWPSRGAGDNCLGGSTVFMDSGGSED